MGFGAGTITVGIVKEPVADYSPSRSFWRSLPLLGLLCCALFANPLAAKTLRIGITLHPYYSFVSNIVGDRAEVVPLIGAEFNPHGYVPKPDDMKRVGSMDLMVVNGIGHDEWAFEIITSAGVRDNLPLIYANDGVALIPVAGDDEKVVNAHTFVSTTAAVQQVYTIARALSRYDPDNASYFLANAREYAGRIRRLKAKYSAELAKLDIGDFRCATMHGGYGYLMQEFGLQVAAVIEPRHGVQPTARQLADTIDRIKAAQVRVIFAEKYFTTKLADTIRDATGVQVFSFSHISGGAYTAEKYEEEMRENLVTLIEAIKASQAGEGI